MSMFSTTSWSSAPRCRRHALERVEVHADQVDRLDLVLVQRVHVGALGADREQPGMDARVERLHAAVEDLGEAGVVLDRAGSRCRPRPARRAVPPVETISTPSSARPRAKSTSPRLSETLSSARRMRTSPGAVTSVPRGSIDIVDQNDTRVVGVDADPPRGDQAARHAAAAGAPRRARAPRSRAMRAGYESARDS